MPSLASRVTFPADNLGLITISSVVFSSVLYLAVLYLYFPQTDDEPNSNTDDNKADITLTEGSKSAIKNPLL